MIKLLTLFTTLLYLSYSEDMRQLFREAMSKYAARDGILRSEGPEMTAKRFKSFVDFHAKVEEVNNDDSRPYTAADNFFSILTEEERQMHLGLNMSGLSPELVVSDTSKRVLQKRGNIPESRDFSGILPEIKDQATCGSCWAFAAAGTLEGEIYFTTGNRGVSLSEQEYLECAVDYDGCRGAWPRYCLQYSAKYDRISTNSGYPYLDRSRNCQIDNTTPNALVDNNVRVMGFTIEKGDEALLQAASQHTVSVAIHANIYFQGYSEGLYVDDTCDQFVNHAVVVVGYGLHGPNNHKFWKVRNSWGKDWGDKGYILMDREMKNMCWIGYLPIVPVVECRDGSCVAPNPNEGDRKEEEEEEYSDFCNNINPLGYLSECMRWKQARDLCKKESSNCLVSRVGKYCYMVTKQNSSDNLASNSNSIIPCNAVEDRGACKDKVYLTNCKTEEEAQRICENKVAAKDCFVVKVEWENKRCFYVTDGRSRGRRWVERNVPCEPCNSAAGLVLCSDCNCCKHKHFCPDTNGQY